MALLPLADPDAAPLLADVPEHERQDCWWLVMRDRTLVPGDAGGGVALTAQLKRTRWLGRLLRMLGADRAVDALDKLISQHRGRLGRLVPDGPAPRRYP